MPRRAVDEFRAYFTGITDALNTLTEVGNRS